MSEEDRLKEVIAMGRQADEWLNNSEFKSTLTAIRAELIMAFEKTASKDRDERDEIWRKLQALTWIVQRMESKVNEGRRANDSLLDRIKNKVRRVI